MKTWNIPTISNQWKEAIEQYKYVLVVIALGLFLLSLPTGSNTPEIIEKETENSYNLREFEEHLATHLSLIQGAGETKVVLSLKNNGETVYAQDVQQEYQGRSTFETVIIGSGTSEQVVEVQQFYPEFQGALIICSGGDSATVKFQLIQAVSSLTGLRSDNITVCKSQH